MKINHKILAYFILITFLVPAVYCHGQDTSTSKSPRPANWAEKIEKPGLPNLHKVSDDLYRGAQPDAQGFAELKKMGIKTIVNMRGSDKEREWFDDSDFKYIHLSVFTPMPSKRKFKRFLDVMSNPANFPVFLHCKHGADRTGAATALYRVYLQGWNVDEALDEMINGGFNFHNYKKLIKIVRELKWKKKKSKK